jgi:hypothetical protein
MSLTRALNKLICRVLIGVVPVRSVRGGELCLPE